MPHNSFQQIAEALVFHWRRVAFGYSLTGLGSDPAIERYADRARKRYRAALDQHERLSGESSGDADMRIGRHYSVINPEPLIGEARGAQAFILEAATLMLAHSTLEAHIADALTLSVALEPERWLPFVQNKTASLSDFRDRGWDDLLSEKTQLELKLQLTNTSLPRKIERLLAVSPGTDGGVTELPCDDTVWLHRLDARRHSLVHDLQPEPRTYPLSHAINQFLRTGLFALAAASLSYRQSWNSPSTAWADIAFADLSN